jgi:hypothetical protein
MSIFVASTINKHKIGHCCQKHSVAFVTRPSILFAITPQSCVAVTGLHIVHFGRGLSWVFCFIVVQLGCGIVVCRRLADFENDTTPG